LSSTEAGLVIASVVAGTVVASLLIGRYADRIGRRRNYITLYLLLAAVGSRLRCRTRRGS
jgi:MFS family permease